MEQNNGNIDISKLYRYSLGICLVDNVDNEKRIKVYPLEKLYTEGDDLLSEDVYNNTVEKKVLVPEPDTTDAKYETSKETVEITKTKYIFASWLNHGQSNRISPPNVTLGEKVILYRFSNRDEFFWETEQTDLFLRKEEHVVYSYSNKTSLDKDEDELEDRYTFTVSSRDKVIGLHTSDTNGEYTTYDFNLLTKDGTIEFLDGKGNYSKLDSTKDYYKLFIKGKKAEYTLELHGDEGYFSLKDDKDNVIRLDSVANLLSAHIDGKSVYDIKIDADNEFVSLSDDKDNILKLDSSTNTLGTHIAGDNATYDLIVAGDDGFTQLTDGTNEFKLDTTSNLLDLNIQDTVNINTTEFNIACTDFNLDATNIAIASTTYTLDSTATLDISTTAYTVAATSLGLDGNIFDITSSMLTVEATMGELSFTTAMWTSTTCVMDFGLGPMTSYMMNVSGTHMHIGNMGYPTAPPLPG